MHHMPKVTDKQWEDINLLLPAKKTASGGRPRVHDRRTFEGVLWVLSREEKWSHLPDKYGSYVTCWRRFNEWEKSGLWTKLWKVYLESLDQREKLEWTIAFLSGNFVPTKKGV